MSGEIDFTQASLDVIGAAGLEVDKQIEPVTRVTPGIADELTQFEFTAQVHDAPLDVHVHIRHGQPHREQPLRSRYQGKYDFNGMLRLDEGCFSVGTTHLAEIMVVSNEIALNATQLILGRTPGEDAYEFVEGEGGKFGAHIWVPGLARMQALIADRRHWQQRREDLDIGDDPLGRIVFPGSMCKGIQAGADRLQEQFGDKFARGISPRQAKRFTGAEEDIKDYAGNIARRLYDNVELTADPRFGLDADRLIRQLKAEALKAITPYPNGSIGFFAKLALELGLVKAEPVRTHKREAIRLYRNIVGNAALMFLRGELAQPRQVDTEAAVRRRLSTLMQIIAAFPQKPCL